MVKKLILWLLAGLFLFFSGIIIYIYHNEDFLKNQLILAVNERLKVPVEVSNISISPLSAFPHASVVFSDVKISDPIVRDSVFAEAKKVSFNFNIWDLLKGDMVLEKIGFSDGQVNIIQYPENQWSYQIYHDNKESSTKALELDIQKIEVVNTQVKYRSVSGDVSWSGFTSDLEASVKVQGSATELAVDTRVKSDYIKVNAFRTLQDQEINIDAKMIIDDSWMLETDRFQIDDSFFALKINDSEEQIKVSFEAIHANIQTLLSIAPSQVHNRLRDYESKGSIVLNGEVNFIKETGKTSVQSALSFESVDISRKNPRIDMKGIDLAGNVKINDITKLDGAVVSLSDIRGTLNGKPMEGHLSISNFEVPKINGSFMGELPLSLLVDVGGINILDSEGALVINLSIDGEMSNDKNKQNFKNLKASGDIGFQAVTFKLPGRDYMVEIPEGSMLLNNDQLAINQLSLNMGKSNFLVNGQLRNFHNVPSGKNWSATADIYSSNFFLDELLSVENSTSNDQYSFRLPDNVDLRLNAIIDNLKVQRFEAQKVSGQISIKQNMLSAEKLSLESMGGAIKVKGTWKENAHDSDVDVQFLLSGINADELFYTFENFNQDFITNENLSGSIYAEAHTQLRLDTNLVVHRKSFKTKVKTRIIDGELKNFEPLYSLEKYLNNADLSRVQFADLENEILIEDEIVKLPMMAVGTNIVKFKIGGEHTFDQHIKYDVVAPLIRSKKEDKDTRFGAIAEDQHGESLLFLKIVGTTEDFEVSLDKEAIKEEIASDVQKEMQELKDAFKNKGKVNVREVELSEDDFFEWEEEGNDQ